MAQKNIEFWRRSEPRDRLFNEAVDLFITSTSPTLAGPVEQEDLVPIVPGALGEEEGDDFGTPHYDPLTDELIRDFTGAGATIPELCAILVHLKALQQLHQTSHWQCAGDSFYGDHLLFQRLYDAVTGEIDSVGERIVGLGSESDVDLGCITRGMMKVLQSYDEGLTSFPSSSSLFNRGLAAEQCFLKCAELLSESICELGHLSKGLDNLIAGILDTHESHIYLLKQRTKTPGLVRLDAHGA